MIYKKRLSENIILGLLSFIAIIFFMMPIYWLITTSLKIWQQMSYFLLPNWFFFEATLKNFK